MHTTSPLHWILGGIALITATIGGNLLAQKGSAAQVAICCIAITLATANLIASDLRSKRMHKQFAEFEAGIWKQQYAELIRNQTELKIITKKNTLGIARTHELLGTTVRILESIAEDKNPTGPQPAVPPKKAPSNIRRIT